MSHVDVDKHLRDRAVFLMALGHDAFNEFERYIATYVVNHVDVCEDLWSSLRTSAIHFNPDLTEGPLF